MKFFRLASYITKYYRPLLFFFGFTTCASLGLMFFAPIHSGVLRNFHKEQGYCWVVFLPKLSSWQWLFYKMPSGSGDSPLVLEENRQALPDPNALHDYIRRQGAGSFSHWGDQIYFSTLYNDDPLTNGKTYSYSVRLESRGWLFLAAFVSMLGLGLVATGLIKHRHKEQPFGWGSPALALGLAVVAPTVFVWSRNWHMYSWLSLGVSFCVLLATAFFIYAAVRFLGARFFYKAESLPTWLSRMFSLLVCAAVTGIVCFLFSASVFAEISSLHRYVLNIIILAVTAGIVFWAGFRPLNFFLAVCLFLFSVTGAIDVLQYYSSYSSRQNQENTDPPNITLKTKPNIYLFWLESYHSLPIMREIYGIDTQQLADYLSSRRFFIYDNVYSNSRSTLSSMQDLYTMKTQFAPERGRMDIDPNGRLAIGGNRDNAVYRILKGNGYHTTYLTMDSPYYFQVKGSYLDETDLPFWSYLFQPILDLNQKVAEAIKNKVALIYKSEYEVELLARIKMVIKEGLQRKSQFYLGFKAGARHSPVGYKYKDKDKENWVASGMYQNAVIQSNQQIADIVDYIITEDPQSVIILLGDHGAHRLRGITEDIGDDLLKLEARLQDNGESLKSLADDMFGTLMAVRMPDGARDISQGYSMSHVNLFKHIFATLSDDAEILKERTPSWSIAHGFVFVKEGVIDVVKFP